MQAFYIKHKHASECESGCSKTDDDYAEEVENCIQGHMKMMNREVMNEKGIVLDFLLMRKCLNDYNVRKNK